MCSVEYVDVVVQCKLVVGLKVISSPRETVTKAAQCDLRRRSVMQCKSALFWHCSSTALHGGCAYHNRHAPPPLMHILTDDLKSHFKALHEQFKSCLSRANWVWMGQFVLKKKIGKLKNFNSKVLKPRERRCNTGDLEKFLSTGVLDVRLKHDSLLIYSKYRCYLL